MRQPCGCEPRTFVRVGVLCVLAACSRLAGAQLFEAKLIASDGAQGDTFGSAVSISGGTLVIGAPNDDDQGSNSGSAYIFEMVNGVWTETARLLPPGSVTGRRFGFSVSVSDDKVLVGVGESRGRGYVFEKIGGMWTRTAILFSDDALFGDYFGHSVSISGDTAIVGAPNDNDQGIQSGSAHVFEKIAGVWTRTAKLLAADGAANDLFGSAVAISGDRVIIGAPNDDDGAANSGSAYIFENVGGDWIQTAKLLAADAAIEDLFGSAVSIDDDAAIVGAPNDDDRAFNAGSAYIFETVGGDWTQTAKLFAADAALGERFGSAVSIDGDAAVVGAFYDDDSGSFSGSTYLFERVSSVWRQTAKLLASDGSPGDYFGVSVSISGGVAIVGAIGDDGQGTESGSTYAFRLFPPCDADLNSDYQLDFFDLQIFLNYFAAGDLRADFIEDGTLDFADVQGFLDAYAAGCP